MSGKENYPDGKLFPYNAIVGILDDIDEAHDATNDLANAGFAEDGIRLLSGERGAQLIETSGKRNGLLGRVFKAIDRIGDEHDETQMHIKALRTGHFVLGVDVADDESKERAQEIMQRHGAHDVHYYSRWTTERLVD